MKITGFDHIVLSCHNVSAMVDFYSDVLGMRTGEERPGKFAIWFGSCKISLQDEAHKPNLARATTPGSGNFCVLTNLDIADVAQTLKAKDVAILAQGPRDGATGPIQSVYFNDPEGNLVEIAQQVAS